MSDLNNIQVDIVGQKPKDNLFVNDNEKKDLKNLEVAIVGGTNRDVFSNVDLSEFTDYIDNVRVEKSFDDLRKQRAQNQSFGEQALRTGATLIPDIALLMAENVGYMAELASPIWEDKSDYSNWLIEAAKSGREKLDEFAPVYRENPNQVIDFTDSAFWLENISGLAESLAAFAATGIGVGTATSAIARQGVKTAAKQFALNAAKTTQLAQQAQLGAQVATAATLAYTEGAMSGNEIFKETKAYWEQQRDSGLQISDEEILQKASEAAARTVSLNVALITPLNLTGVGLLFKTNNQLAKTSRKMLLGENIDDYGKRLQGQIKEIEKQGYKKYGITTGVGIEALQEGVEEELNVVSEYFGRQEGGLPQHESLFEKVTSDEGILSFFLGAIGGSGQSLVMNGFKAKQVTEENKKEYEASIGRIKLITDTIEKQADLMKKFNEAVVKGDITESESLKQQLFDQTSLFHVMDGSSDVLKNTFEEVTKVKNTDLGIEVQKQIDEVTKQLQQVESEEEKVQLEEQLKQLNDQFKQVSGKSDAMIKGFAKDMKDDSYISKANKKIDEIKYLEKKYDEYNDLLPLPDGSVKEGVMKHMLSLNTLDNHYGYKVNKYREKAGNIKSDILKNSPVTEFVEAEFLESENQVLDYIIDELKKTDISKLSDNEKIIQFGTNNDSVIKGKLKKQITNLEETKKNNIRGVEVIDQKLEGKKRAKINKDLKTYQDNFFKQKRNEFLQNNMDEEISNFENNEEIRNKIISNSQFNIILDQINKLKKNQDNEAQQTETDNEIADQYNDRTPVESPVDPVVTETEQESGETLDEPVEGSGQESTFLLEEIEQLKNQEGQKNDLEAKKAKKIIDSGFYSQETEFFIEIKGDNKDFLLTWNRNSDKPSLWGEKQSDGTYKATLEYPNIEQIQKLVDKYVPIKLLQLINEWTNASKLSTDQVLDAQYKIARKIDIELKKLKQPKKTTQKKTTKKKTETKTNKENDTPYVYDESDFKKSEETDNDFDNEPDVTDNLIFGITSNPALSFANNFINQDNNFSLEDNNPELFSGNIKEGTRLKVKVIKKGKDTMTFDQLDNDQKDIAILDKEGKILSYIHLPSWLEKNRKTLERMYKSYDHDAQLRTLKHIRQQIIDGKTDEIIVTGIFGENLLKFNNIKELKSVKDNFKNDKLEIGIIKDGVVEVNGKIIKVDNKDEFLQNEKNNGRSVILLPKNASKSLKAVTLKRKKIKDLDNVDGIMKVIRAFVTKSDDELRNKILQASKLDIYSHKDIGKFLKPELLVFYASNEQAFIAAAKNEKSSTTKKYIILDQINGKNSIKIYEGNRKDQTPSNVPLADSSNYDKLEQKLKDIIVNAYINVDQIKSNSEYYRVNNKGEVEKVKYIDYLRQNLQSSIKEYDKYGKKIYFPNPLFNFTIENLDVPESITSNETELVVTKKEEVQENLKNKESKINDLIIPDDLDDYFGEENNDVISEKSNDNSNYNELLKVIQENQKLDNSNYTTEQIEEIKKSFNNLSVEEQKATIDQIKNNCKI
jgi:hypothetical protein